MRFGTLLFAALATAAFVWMVKRPAVDITAMQFGMPVKVVEASSAESTIKSEAATKEVEVNNETVTDKATEEQPTSDESSPKAEDSNPD